MFSVDKNIIYVKNSKGNILWNFVNGVVVEQEYLKVILDIENIDDDTQKEVIAGTYDIQNDKYSITLFDHDGRIIWQRMISTNETFFKIKIKNFFRPSPVKFARSNVNEIFVISKWNHMERFLGIIACYDLEGNLLHQYLHVGNLSSTMELIDLDGDGGDEIVFTGTNNLLNGEGIVGVLPLKNFHGISPPYRIEPEYSHQAYRLKNYLADKMVRGNQLVYLRFKRTDHLSKYKAAYINTGFVYSSDNLIQIRLIPWIFEGAEPGRQFLQIHYVFDMNFTLKRILAPPVTLEKYPELLKKRDIDITLEELLKIYSRIVFRWESDRWVPVKSNIPN
jgi:outer membrane protein assembly factor BamB